MFGQILTGQTGGQLYSDISPYKVSECSLPKVSVIKLMKKMKGRIRRNCQRNLDIFREELHTFFMSKMQQLWGAAITQWICLYLPSSCPGFESQAHHLCFFQIVYLSFELECEKNKNNQKDAGIGPFLKKSKCCEFK